MSDYLLFLANLIAFESAKAARTLFFDCWEAPPKKLFTDDVYVLDFVLAYAVLDFKSFTN